MNSSAVFLYNHCSFVFLPRMMKHAGSGLSYRPMHSDADTDVISFNANDPLYWIHRTEQFLSRKYTKCENTSFYYIFQPAHIMAVRLRKLNKLFFDYCSSYHCYVIYILRVISAFSVFCIFFKPIMKLLC